MSDGKKKKSAEIINPGLGDIEKVRDILFGKYVSSFESRFEELESRLESDMDELKSRMLGKIDEIDSVINKALSKLDDRVVEETEVRSSELQAIQSSFQAAEQKLQHSISLMEDETNQGLKKIRDSISATREELQQQSSKQQLKLETEKVSRQNLARLLDEVALKLRGED